MTTKLTLTIEKDVIEKAKIYAKGTQRSLSELVQNYLDSLVNKTDSTKDSTSIVDRIAGSLPFPKDVTDDDLENYKREYLERKYL